MSTIKNYYYHLLFSFLFNWEGESGNYTGKVLVFPKPLKLKCQWQCFGVSHLFFCGQLLVFLNEDILLSPLTNLKHWILYLIFTSFIFQVPTVTATPITKTRKTFIHNPQYAVFHNSLPGINLCRIYSGTINVSFYRSSEFWWNESRQ